MRVLILNGPNLNLLGKREPDVYGTETLADLEQAVVAWGIEMGLEVETFQSNHEGALIDAIQRSDVDGIVLNPAAYTHTSRAIADAIAAVSTPVVEVHISNIKEREAWRAESFISGVCSASIFGRGISGYRDALRHLVNRAAIPFERIRYGPGPDHTGDLRRGGENLAVIIHGGFWRSEWTSDTTESIAVDLTRRGFTTWNIEYRRLRVGGGWPACADDVLAALDFVGGLEIGPGRVMVIGHSAGGYLGMWAAQRSVTSVERLAASHHSPISRPTPGLACLAPPKLSNSWMKVRRLGSTLVISPLSWFTEKTTAMCLSSTRPISLFERDSISSRQKPVTLSCSTHLKDRGRGSSKPSPSQTDLTFTPTLSTGC